MYSRGSKESTGGPWAGLGESFIEGMKMGGENNRAKENQYAQALEHQRTYEMQKEKQDFELAKQHLNLLSQRYPVGDPKADNAYKMFQQTQEYKSLASHIKEGMPWAVQDGEIQRIPQYQVLLNKAKSDENALEQKVLSGQGNPQETMDYFKAKGFKDTMHLAEQAAITKLGSNFDPTSADTQKEIANNYQGIIQAKMQSVQNPQEAPPSLAAPPAQSPGMASNIGNTVLSGVNALAGFLNPHAQAPAQAQAPPIQVPPTQPPPQNPQGQQLRVPNYKVVR